MHAHIHHPHAWIMSIFGPLRLYVQLEMRGLNLTNPMFRFPFDGRVSGDQTAAHSNSRLETSQRTPCYVFLTSNCMAVLVTTAKVTSAFLVSVMASQVYNVASSCLLSDFLLEFAYSSSDLVSFELCLLFVER